MTQSKAALFALAGALAMLAPISPATAQNSIGTGNPLNQLSMPDKQEDPSVVERREAVDREYRATRGALPPQTGTATIDPWANMRGAEETRPKPVQRQSATAPKKKPAQ
jgi:hypothetical protein